MKFQMRTGWRVGPARSASSRVRSRFRERVHARGRPGGVGDPPMDCDREEREIILTVGGAHGEKRRNGIGLARRPSTPERGFRAGRQRNLESVIRPMTPWASRRTAEWLAKRSAMPSPLITNDPRVTVLDEDRLDHPA